ncbi:YHYH protein [Flavobacterium algicola]|uniref:YHYH protein n=1 Tax=Flavobacterium algicola TaxID=556529 RepID=UPI001EFC7E4E|nr:YHYH protein [Flavobacterium algicola]MCG9791683.1 YHYH protein [Flavobacterium algicola]
MVKIVISLVILFQMGCSKTEDTASDDIAATGAVDITSVVLNKYFNGVTMATTASSIVLKSNGLPDHKTPYWGEGNALYEDFPEGFHANVNTSMSEHDYTMTITTRPSEATSHEETTLGAIGMALNGVPIYNDREGGNVALDALTITTFDYSGAHPGPGEDYHYHTTGKYTSTDDAKLIGFLRDGFPLYGRRDQDNTYPELDTYGGHVGATADFPDGIYHYHASNINYLNTGYYILKAGSYYGAKGSFTN